MTLTPHASAVLSVNRALWDRVTPALRGVCVSWQGGIEARFFYEVEPTELERDLVDEAETEVMADQLPGTEVRCVAVYLPVARRRTLPPDSAWVYLRWETTDDVVP